MKKQVQREGRRPRATAPAVQENQNEARSDDIRARIAAAAYTLYEGRGCQHGRHLEDWLAAERAVLDGIEDAPSGHSV